jgi:hypothetical protein
LLGFLPDDIPAIPFTIGNLVDVIINVYIILTIGIIPYRWHKSAREPGIAFKDLQLAVLIDPSDVLAKPCRTKQCLVYDNTRKQGGGALYSGLDRMKNPSGLSFPASRRAEAQANAYHFPVDPAVQMARKNTLNVITETMLDPLSVSALYPRSRARLQGARDGYRSFSGKTRAMVIQFPIGINKKMET